MLLKQFLSTGLRYRNGGNDVCVCILYYGSKCFWGPWWSMSDVPGLRGDLREAKGRCKHAPTKNCMMSVTAFYPYYKEYCLMKSGTTAPVERTQYWGRMWGL